VQGYCGFISSTERELKEHVLKTHGARDDDWKGRVSQEEGRPEE
jgi:hypothetical protein